MANPFTPQQGDAAVDMLRLVFGSVMDNIVPGVEKAAVTASSSMLAAAFRYFNSGVLMFGTLILTYVTVMGIVNTANDGEALGKRWSTFYTPLRTFTAAAALIPGSSGYAGIQIVMLIFVTYSIGFASNMWTSINEYVMGTNVAKEAVKSIVKDPNFDSLALNALRMSLCANGVNAAMASVSPDSQLNLQYSRVPAPPVTTLDGGQINTTTFMFKDPKWPNSEVACGKLVMTSSYTAPPKDGSKLANDVAPSIKKAIDEVRARYVASFFTGEFSVQATQVAAAAIANGTTTIDSQTIAKLLDDLKDRQMNDIVAAVENAIAAENGGSVNKMTEKGWVYAGSLYREIGRIKDAVRNTTVSSSEYVAGLANPLEPVLTGDSLSAANAVYSPYEAVAAELSKRVFETASQTPSKVPEVPKLKTNFTSSDFTDGGGFVDGIIKKYINQFSGWVLSGAIHYLEDPDSDPIMKVKNLGDWIAGVGEAMAIWKAFATATMTAIAKGLGNSAIPGTAPLSGLAEGALATLVELWSLISPSVLGLMYLGYYLGIWIPMVPFFIFATGVVGWLVFVVEMMAAGMLWAAAHTTPAREDSFIGSQTQGYMLLMSGFFRPALMVIGLVASNTLLYPTTAYLNEAFLIQFRSLQANSITGPFTLAGYFLIYSMMISAAFMLLFSLPQALPDNVLRWIGAGVGDLGEKGMAQKLEGSASSQARQAAVWGSAKGQGLDRMRQSKLDGEKQRAAAESTEKRHKELIGALGGKAHDTVGETGQSIVSSNLDHNS
ncbi:MULTISPECIES: DotA/TraY family protein [Cupriavidus]